MLKQFDQNGRATMRASDMPIRAVAYADLIAGGESSGAAAWTELRCSKLGGGLDPGTREVNHPVERHPERGTA